MAAPPHRQLQNAADSADASVPRRVRAVRAASEGVLTEDGFTTAMELALTPAVFGAIGFGLDRWLGVTPLLTILLSLWAFIVVAWMTFRRYDDKMTRLEAELPAKGLRSRAST